MSFPKPLEEFDFDFSLSQHVQALKRKLHHARTILDGTLRTVTAISTHAEAVRKIAEIPAPLQEAFLRELSNISRDLESYSMTTAELLNLSDDIKLMVMHQKPFTLCCLTLGCQYILLKWQSRSCSSMNIPDPLFTYR